MYISLEKILLIFIIQIYTTKSFINQINEQQEIKYLYPFLSTNYLYATIINFYEVNTLTQILK